MARIPRPSSCSSCIATAASTRRAPTCSVPATRPAPYYIISGSVSIIAGEEDGRELVLGYIGPGEFVGEMGLFVETEQRGVALRTRTACEMAEIYATTACSCC